MKNLIRRKILDNLMYGIMAAAMAGVIIALLFIIIYIFRSQAGFLTFSFLVDKEHGILPMIVTTLYVVLVSIAVALPVGIATAVFLNEYSVNSPFVRILRLAIETLAGIPSIIYGLFGLLVFCRLLSFGQSIIAGSFTLSIMILPVIIRTTEESLKSIPDAFREGSLALGATKFQTIIHIVLPSALPGIVTSAILAIGRIVGESAPVLLTVGLTKNMPHTIFESGRTLTIHLYYLTNEAVRPEDFGIAFATASVLVILVVIINTSTKIVTNNFRKKLGDAL
ncbi:MAG: phosphate ABC transporter permease PstA [Spirochaetes bacterium]|nr:phosphate ABC transporter permease PstA [Brevinematales bacterium]MCL1959326.1 phosphate ABC transporter permease PstA [Spirochaetota bacterium]